MRVQANFFFVRVLKINIIGLKAMNGINSAKNDEYSFLVKKKPTKNLKI